MELIWIGRVPLTRRSFVNIVDDMIRFSEVRLDISQTIDTMETKTKLYVYTFNILPSKIFLILFLRYQIRRYGSINYLETVIGSIYPPSESRMGFSRRSKQDWTREREKGKSGKIEGNSVQSACTYREGNVVLLETCLGTSRAYLKTRR